MRGSFLVRKERGRVFEGPPNLNCEKKGTSLGEFQGTRRERKREEINMLSQKLG